MKFYRVAVVAAISLFPFSGARLLGRPHPPANSKTEQVQSESSFSVHYKKIASPDRNLIVGGSDVTDATFAFYAKFGQCNAALIHQDIVLTTGRCAEIVSANDITVGKNVLGTTEEAKTVVNRRVHPNFISLGLEDNIAVMKLDTPSNKSPVAFGTNNPSVGETLTVIGLGWTSASSGTTPSTLQEKQVQSVSDSDCATAHGALNAAKTMCAEEGGCINDLGDPLLKLVGSDYVQVGILSNVLGSCQGAGASGPDLYTEVANYKDWIDAQICELSNSRPSSCPALDSTAEPVRVEITYDSNPEETSWRILDSGNNEVVVFDGNKTRYQGGFTTERVYLPRGQQYTLEVIDDDGIAGGGDIIKVIQKTLTGDEEKVTGNGQFTGTFSADFSIAGSPLDPGNGGGSEFGEMPPF